jgi:hypothetical protein
MKEIRVYSYAKIVIIDDDAPYSSWAVNQPRR